MAVLSLDLLWLAILAISLRYFYQLRYKLKELALWHKTLATINSCEWQFEAGRRYPIIEYNYTVKQKKYRNSNVFVDNSYNFINSKYAVKKISALVNSWKNNEAVEVYYDPCEPENATLDLRVPKKLKYINYFLGFLVVTQLLVVVYHVGIYSY